jgi:hypothetical protein
MHFQRESHHLTIYAPPGTNSDPTSLVGANVESEEVPQDSGEDQQHPQEFFDCWVWFPTAFHRTNSFDKLRPDKLVRGTSMKPHAIESAKRNSDANLLLQT